MKAKLISLIVLLIALIVLVTPLLFVCLFAFNLEVYEMSNERLGQERLGFGALGLILIVIDNTMVALIVILIMKLRGYKKIPAGVASTGADERGR